MFSDVPTGLALFVADDLEVGEVGEYLAGQEVEVEVNIVAKDPLTAKFPPLMCVKPSL